MRVLGIDPGYERMGIAVVERLPHTKDVLVYSSCVRTRTTAPFEKRLHQIGSAFEECLNTYRPHAVALETLYLTNNHRTAMRVSEARGVLLFVASQHNLPIFEYTPPQIKVAISGSGRGNKQDIQKMIPRLLALKKAPRLDDEYDAIAIALTALASEQSLR
jgi:crossover junction endodeoxyribonuclease RuvC